MLKGHPWTGVQCPHCLLQSFKMVVGFNISYSLCHCGKQVNKNTKRQEFYLQPKTKKSHKNTCCCRQWCKADCFNLFADQMSEKRYQPNQETERNCQSHCLQVASKIYKYRISCIIQKSSLNKQSLVAYNNIYRRRQDCWFNPAHGRYQPPDKNQKGPSQKIHHKCCFFINITCEPEKLLNYFHNI